MIAEHLRKSTRFAEAINVRLAESTRTASRGAYVETEGHCVAALAFVENSLIRRCGPRCNSDC